MDFRAAARARLPRFLFDYIDGGSFSEETHARNRLDLQSIRLRQRVLRDVSDIELGADILGQKLGMPVILGPVGLAGMYARRGEVQAAKAASSMAVPFCLSTVSLCPLDEVTAGSGAPPWFQLYVIRDRAFMRDLLERATDVGSPALVFTVDMPLPGIRYRDSRSGLSGARATQRRLIQALIHPHWAWNVGIRGRPHLLGNVRPVLRDASGLEDFMGWLSSNFDPTVSWADLEWIRSHWNGPLVIKGILTVEDAQSARTLGADGIVVSNHGGRQLDGATSTAKALPRIADAVAGDMTVLADSGVRSGLDVVRMLALGAHGVMLGRAWAYALAAGGEGGVRRLLEMIAAEMRVAMALTGCTGVSDLDSSILEAASRERE